MGLREDDNLTFISDRHIGLIDGVNSEFSGACNGFCIRHICRNIKDHFKDSEIEKYFINAAYALSTDAFDEIMKQLGEYNGDAMTYLEEIGKEHWAISAFNDSRFGHMTNNVSESFNSLLLETREKPHLYVLVDIYLYCMNKYYERRTKEISGINFYNHIFTSTAINKLTASCNLARRCNASVSDEKSAIVKENGDAFVVNLSEAKCSCNMYRDEGFPCRHAVCLATRLGKKQMI